MADAESQSYKVTGPYAVFGHAPGAEFKAAIDPRQAERLISAGHLKRVTAPKKQRKE